MPLFLYESGYASKVYVFVEDVLLLFTLPVVNFHGGKFFRSDAPKLRLITGLMGHIFSAGNKFFLQRAYSKDAPFRSCECAVCEVMRNWVFCGDVSSLNKT